MAELSSNSLPFEVLSETETTQRIGLELEVYAFDNPMQLLDVVPRRLELKSLDELRGSGGGGFKILRSDEKLVDTPNLLAYRNVCKVSLDNKVIGGFLIQNKKSDYVNREERAGEFWEVSGGGLREWTRDAVVEPRGGIKPDSQATRYFSFASERGDWYNDADWVAPVLIQQHNLDPNTDPFGTAPAEWPDAPSAYWIWGESNSATDPAPPGINFFRREFIIDVAVGTKNYSVFAAAKDEFDIYIDGQIIIESREFDGYAKTWRADFELGPGSHVLAARVRANGSGQAGLIAAMFRAGDAATSTPAELLYVTNSAWKVNAYPDPAPGWTPGEILLTLFAEAEERGVRFPTFLTPTFTSTQDSTGLPWPRSLDWAFEVGTEYYDVIERLEELVCDVWIDPATLELNAYIERGVHRDVQSAAVQPVHFEIGKNVTRAEESGTSSIKNVLLMSTEDGWQEVADGSSTSIADYGRVEGYVSTGASGSVSNDIASAVFTQRAEPETSSTYEIIDVDDARPHSDFFVGDWVLAPGAEDENVSESRHIMSIAVEENRDTGRPVFAVEFDTIFQDRAARYERWLKTTTDGTLGGTLANVSGGGGGGSGSPTTQNTQTGPQGLQGLAGPRGITWRGLWDIATEYVVYDAVEHDGSSWIAISATVGQEPSLIASAWELIAAAGVDGDQGLPGEPGTGLTYQGTWSALTAYAPNDIVAYSGALWITAVSSTGSEPGVSADWQEYSGGGGGSGLSPRDTVVYVTASLAAAASEQGTVDLGESFQLYRIEADKPCRVRLYGTAAQQAADVARSGADDVNIETDHGLIFEGNLGVGLQAFNLSPIVVGANMETIISALIPITVDNLSETAEVVTVTLTYVRQQ